MNSINEHDEYQMGHVQFQGRMSTFGLAAMESRNNSQRPKLRKLEFKTLLTPKRNSPVPNKLPKLSSPDKNLMFSRSQRSITHNFSPAQKLGRTFRVNTDMDESLLEEDKNKFRIKRDDKKRKGSLTRQGQINNLANEKFDKNLYEMIDQLNKLKIYLNNSRKLYQVIKNIVGTRKNLKRILLQNGKQELVDSVDIKKQCIIKEFATINGEQKLVEKYDLSLQEDIVFAKEAIEGLRVQNELQRIRRMGDQKSEITKIKELLGMKSMQEEQIILSVQSAAMSGYQLHEELELLEQRLGPFQCIPKQARLTSQAITEIVESIKKFD